MEVQASAKFVRISPKKVQPMVRALRGMEVANALDYLKYHTSKPARLVYKLLRSVSANASNNYNLKEDNLRIRTLTVDSGPTMKRYWFRSHGAADPLLKRTSHIRVVVEEIKPSLVKKPVAAPKPIAAKTLVTPPSVPAAPALASVATKTRPNKFAQGFKKVLTRRTTNK